MHSSSHGSVLSIPLQRSFYKGDTVIVARELLGKILVRRIGATTLEGAIVEVEAYRGYDDPASHAYGGQTRRNLVMFGEPGHAYVYFTYGMHYCLNVTTEPAGQPGAVLIRALEPVKGTKRMIKERGTKKILELTNGPARLAQAFVVTKALNGHDLTIGRKLFIRESNIPEPVEIESSARIGIRAGLERPWRFFISGNPFVSK